MRGNKIIGGYNPLDLNENCGCKRTPNSFIFSFENYNNINTGRIGRVKQESYAVYCDNLMGPCFGNLGNYDIFPNFYFEYFEIDDYEVFQVVKKRK